jgi:nucleoside-diphosphate-sugar epimerase
MEALAVRPPAVYGPRDADFLPLFRLAKRGWFPKIGRRPRPLSLVHAADLAEGIRLALERGRRDAVYYLTDGGVHEVFAMGQAIGAALGRKVRPLFVPHAAFWVVALAGELQAGAFRRPAPLNLDRLKQFLRTGWTASDARARIELGYRPRFDLPQGVEDTVRWYRSVGWI